MGAFELMQESDRSLDERLALRMENNALLEEMGYLRQDVAELREAQEDLLRVSDAFDNIGWSPLSEQEANEMPLRTVKKMAQVSRALISTNPFVKRGVEARISYIWGRGVTFDGVTEIQDILDKNRKKLFSTQAYHEYERVLATDGNAFTALPIDNEDATAFRVGLDEIVGAVTNPLDKEEIWYFKRQYKVAKTNASTGQETVTVVTKYYASLDYYRDLEKRGKSLPRRWNDAGVEQNYVMHHIAVNKQIGWKWGLPDIAAVIFWAKAYKEYLEDNANLVKAYSRIAWQIKAGSQSGLAAASAQVARPPARDPITGEPSRSGATAVTGLAGEIQALPAVGSSVDFTKGSPLAAAIASGLEVSLIVLTSDAGTGNRASAQTLDLPTLKAMQTRQLVHSQRFLDMFEFWGADITPPNLSVASERKPIVKTATAQEAVAETDGPTGAQSATVTWPQIESDSTKDRVAALGVAVEEGMIYKQEARKEALDVFNIAPYKPWNDLPTMEDDPKAMQDFQQAQLQAQQLAQQNQGGAVPAQGKSGGIAAKGGALNTPNSARDNRAQDSKK